jgi:vitamin B12/bleomycin/antimicrobial peptide transport system ATP-binding/permease protein
MLHILGQFGRLLAICARAPGGRSQLLLLAVVIALELGAVYTGVRLVQWTGEFYAAIQKVDAPEIGRQIGIFSLIVALNSVRGLAAGYLRKKLEILWRKSLTDHAISLWTADKAHWHMANSASDRIDNPDQRIADDCRIFVTRILNEALDLIGRVVGLFSYLALLWGLSNFPLSLGFVGIDLDIPRYMIWAAFIYVALSTGVTHLLGRPLKRLLSEQQRREADFRFAMARWRTESDEVALSDGEEAEKLLFQKRFAAVAQNWRRLMRRELILGTFTFPFQHTVLRIPLFVALPGYIAGHVAFGGLMQLAMAFSNVVTSLSWIIFSYRDLSELVAASSRLDRFMHAARSATALRGKDLQSSRGGRSFQIVGLTLQTPTGRNLLSVSDLSISPGETVTLRGESGVGKTTLTKAIAGLWQHGSGQITKPDGNGMFVPQKAYVPDGDIIDAAAYPATRDRFDSAAIEEVICAVGLGHVLGSQGDPVCVNGNVDKLSGGELQRLAIARLLLHKPDWAVLDEATSALDPASETAIFTLLRKRLKATTLIVIAHQLPQALAELRTIDLSREAQPQSLETLPL